MSGSTFACSVNHRRLVSSPGLNILEGVPRPIRPAAPGCPTSIHPGLQRDRSHNSRHNSDGVIAAGLVQFFLNRLLPRSFPKPQNPRLLRRRPSTSCDHKLYSGSDSSRTIFQDALRLPYCIVLRKGHVRTCKQPTHNTADPPFSQDALRLSPFEKGRSPVATRMPPPPTSPPPSLFSYHLQYLLESSLTEAYTRNKRY